MLIGLTYDLRQDYLAEGYGEEETAEFDRSNTVDALDRSLRALGHETDRVGRIGTLVKRLARGDRWDLVYNLAEGLRGLGREAQVPALLDAYQIPYTYSDPLVCALGLHKGMAKRVVRDLGLPTPDFALVTQMRDVDRVQLPFPLFAKPVAEGTSKGVNARSKVSSPAQLRAACAALLEQFRQPVLVETFLPGREFTVGIVGTGDDAEVVAAMEVNLLPNADADAYTYANKARFEERVRYALPEPQSDIACEAAQLSLATWRGLNCRDGGRVDVRADASGRLNFLEVNPLPGIDPESSDPPIMARLAGWTYPQLIARIVASASQRVGPLASSLALPPRTEPPPAPFAMFGIFQ